jgi:predicted nucleic acid-binding protein
MRGTRRRRLPTLQQVSALVPRPVDASAAHHWARLRVSLHEQDRRIGVNDPWIAAVALAHELPVITQDDDFDVLSELGLWRS